MLKWEISGNNGLRWAGFPTNAPFQCACNLQAAYSLLRALSVYLTHSTRPRRTKKCERQPSRSQTEGVRVGVLSGSIRSFHRGLASGMRASSICCPHPHGHRMPTLQSSPASRRRTRLRRGNFLGSASPAKTSSCRGGSTFSRRFRIHMGHFIYCPLLQLVQAGRVAVLRPRAREAAMCGQ